MVELGRSAGGSLGGGLTYASLFSGCGGADIGLCAAGLKPLWFCEIAEKPSDVLRYRYPDVPNYGDIEKLDPETLEVPGVLWMSPPCQDISIAGAQVGLKGERSGLFYEAIRICRTLVRRGTSIVLMEQVPNLRSILVGRDMASVLGEFLDIGARDIGWTLLDTQFAGIPQSRDRIFFAVDFRGERASEILSFASRLCRDASPRRKAGEGITGTLAAGTRSGGRGSSADEANQLVPVVAGTITAEFADQTGQDCHNLLPVIHDGRGRGDGETSPTLCTDHAGRPSDQCPVIVTHDPVATLRADMAKTIDQCGSHGAGPTNAVIALHPRAIGRDNEIRTMDVAGALAANAGMKQQSYLQSGMQVRRLTPRECERLQGFPDDWTRWGINRKGEKYELADTPRYRMIGNAVSSCWGQQLGERVLEAAS